MSAGRVARTPDQAGSRGRGSRGSGRTANRNRIVTVLGIALAGASIWPMVEVFRWLGVNVATVEQMSRRGPQGFPLLAAVLMFVRPLLAAAAAATVPRGVIRALVSPPQLSPGILFRAAVVQAALTIGLLATGPVVNATLSRALPMVPDRRTPGAIVTPAHFVGLQERAAAAVLPGLVSLALAGAALAAYARSCARTRLRSG